MGPATYQDPSKKPVSDRYVDLIATNPDYQPVYRAMRPHRGDTPLNHGFGRAVHFDKGHLNRCGTLLKLPSDGPRYFVAKIDVAGYKPADRALIYQSEK